MSMPTIDRKRDVQYPPQAGAYCLDYAIGASREEIDAKELKDGTVARREGFREVPRGMPNLICGVSAAPLDAQVEHMIRIIQCEGFFPVNMYNANGMGHYIGVCVRSDGSIRWRLPIFSYEGQSQAELRQTCDTVFDNHQEAMHDLVRRFRALMPIAAQAPKESKAAEDRRQAEVKAAEDLAATERLIAQLQAQDHKARNEHRTLQALFGVHVQGSLQTLNMYTGTH